MHNCYYYYIYCKATNNVVQYLSKFKVWTTHGVNISSKMLGTFPAGILQYNFVCTFLLLISKALNASAFNNMCSFYKNIHA